MITFDQINQVFYLNTKNTTYAMGVWNNEILLHRYWGKKLVNSLNKTDLSDYPTRNAIAVDLDNGNKPRTIYVRNTDCTWQTPTPGNAF